MMYLLKVTEFLQMFKT